MDAISITFLVITALSLLIGVLLGRKRGMGRTLLRLAFLLVAAVAAYLLLDVVLAAFVDRPVLDGKTLEEALTDMLPEESANMASVFLPVGRILLRMALFGELFLVLSFLSWILFKLLLVFLKHRVRFRRRGVGGWLGFVQGALVAICLIVPIHTLLVQSNVLMHAMEGTTEDVGATVEGEGEATAVEAYISSPVCRVFSFISTPFSSLLTQGKDAEGNPVSIAGQLAAVEAADDVMNQLQTLTELKLSDGLTEDGVQHICDVLYELGTTRDGLQEESVDTLTNLVQAAADSLSLPVDLSTLDLATVDFASEAALIETLYAYQQNGSAENAKATVQALVKSDLAMTVLEEADAVISLNDAQRYAFEGEISAIDDADTVRRLRSLFGLNS